MNAQEEQYLYRALKDNPALFRGMKQWLVERRDQRREQAEHSEGEKAVVLRGQCRELTAILNEMFKEVEK